jgi:two-component system sensor histidine kinase PilS (NtrC family)
MFNKLSINPTLGNTRGDKQLRQHLLWLMFIRVIFFTLLIGVTVGLEHLSIPALLPSATVTLAFLAIIYIFSTGGAALLNRKGVHLQRFAIFQLFADTIFATLLVYGTGCSQSIFTPVFMLPVIAGGMIMYRSGGLMAAAAATIFYGTLLLLEYTGNIPSHLSTTRYPPQLDIQKAASIFAVYGITFFLAALLSGTLAARLRTTERVLKRTEFNYEQLSLLYKQIFDDINTGIITVDHHGYISSYNASAHRITGFSPNEVTGHPLSSFFPSITFDNISDRQVSDLKRKDGTTIRVGYSFTSLNLPPDIDIDLQNNSNSRLITMQDISTIEKIEKRMRKAEKMAAIGELSAKVAHDFRNPLAAICGSAQLLAVETNNENGKATNKILNDIILREGNRMAKTISDFLQFSQPADARKEWFNLSKLINEVIHNLKPVKGKTVTEKEYIHVDCPETVTGFGDRQQIQTVITHLVKNSITMSSEKDGPIIIRAGETGKKGESFYLEVIDQGKGIEPVNMAKIFKPFFSTRENGTGLGLAIVQQLTENHNGRIEVKSKPAQGCIMRITLPLPDDRGKYSDSTPSDLFTYE